MTCSIISINSKFLLNPISPVAQNPQPNGQPAWEETQTVFRLPLCRIKTDSILRPSFSVILIFMVSLVFERRISALIERGQASFNFFRNSNGNEEVSAQSSISSWNTADFACFNRYFDSVSRIFSKLVKSIFIINSCQTRRRGKCSRSDSFVNSPDDNLPRGKIFPKVPVS